VLSLVILGAALALVGRSANAQTQIQIYGSWHCGSDFCTWGSVRDMTATPVLDYANAMVPNKQPSTMQ
jgi:hypothetical protein